MSFGAVLTRNAPTDKLARFLVGKYNDQQFGSIEAKGFSGIAPPTVQITPPATAVVDSVVLQLAMDFYYYGSPDSSQQTMQVFEVLDTIQPTSGYYSTTEIAYSPKALGEATFSVSPSFFENAVVLNSDADTSNNVHIQVKMKLPNSYGQRLLNDMVNNPTLFTDVNAFIGKYKGFAFVMKDGDKIVGFNPVFTGTSPTARNTRLMLYYDDAGVQSRSDFPLYYANNFTVGITFPGISFTTIATDRSSTALAGIQDFIDFIPADKRFYVQSGTTVLTKLDLTKFYSFVDTMDNVLFNSAEVVMSNVSSTVAPIQVQLRLLDSTNHFRSPYVDSLVSGVIIKVIDPYLAKIPTAIVPAPTSSNAVDVRADQGSLVAIGTDKSIGKFFITEFAQQIYRHKNDKRRIGALGLMPQESEFSKSVSSLVLDPGVTLRLYYSRPIIRIQ